MYKYIVIKFTTVIPCLIAEVRVKLQRSRRKGFSISSISETPEKEENNIGNYSLHEIPSIIPRFL